MNVLSTFQDHTCWVNDWGIASYSTFVRVTTGASRQRRDEGRQARRHGICPAVADGDVLALQRGRQVLGEDVYMLADPEHRELAPHEKFTQADLDEVCKALLRPLSESLLDPSSN